MSPLLTFETVLVEPFGNQMPMAKVSGFLIADEADRRQVVYALEVTRHCQQPFNGRFTIEGIDYLFVKALDIVLVVVVYLPLHKEVVLRSEFFELQALIPTGSFTTD